MVRFVPEKKLWWKRCRGMLLLFFCYALMFSASAKEKPAISVITIDGSINSGSAEYMVSAMDHAEKHGDVCLIIKLDTPGGFLADTQLIVKRLLAMRIPTVVYVSPKGAQAASAGTFITLAAHVAVMAPGTRIGAAHPVSTSFLPGPSEEKKTPSKDAQRDYMMEKVENDTASFIIGIAQERGRNTAIAEKMVRQSISLNADLAVKENLVDFIADSFPALLESLNGRLIKIDKERTIQLHTLDVPLNQREMTLRQRLLNFLADPNVLMLLFTVGTLGLTFEFFHPGLFAPGVIGGICLLLAITSMRILPINYGALVLIIIGIGLFIAELYITSFGLLGVGGALCLLLGGILLINPAEQPFYMNPGQTLSLKILIPIILTFVLIFFYLGYYVLRAQQRKTKTGIEGMIGLIGEAKTEINPHGGQVFIRGELWKAVSQEIIIPGAKVEVIDVEGLMLQVQLKK